jgi:hypothetical protein
MATTNQITGGAFQDTLGNLLANGYITLLLSDTAVVNTNTRICEGYEITIPLDSNGDIVTSPEYSVWPNDVLTPSTTFYTVSAYTENGELVWGPNYVQVLSSPSPFDVGVWIP